MDDDALVGLARSDAPRVWLEAAAGCGKTHTVLEIGRSFARRLDGSQRVLVLAHTNAAVEVVRDRAQMEGLRIDASTFDSLAYGVVRDYAAMVGFSPGFRPGEGVNEVPFSTLSCALGDLLEAAPAVGAALSARYPVVVCDEHQDASRAQHRCLEALSRHGSKVRVLGDPLQTIYDDADVQPWEETTTWAVLGGRLTVPRRWPHSPSLGEWLSAVRGRLLGTAVEAQRPPEVQVRLLSNLDDLHHRSKAPPLALTGELLDGLLPRLDGSIGILVLTRANGLGLRVALRQQVHLDEVSALEHGYSWLKQAASAEGDPRALALCVVGLLQDTATGLQKPLRDQLGAVLGDDEISLGRKVRIAPIVEVLESIYERPTLREWVSVVGRLAANPPEPLGFARPEAALLIGRLRYGPLAQPVEEFTALIRLRRNEPLPLTSIATIHRAKGREFDHIVVPCLGGTLFPDDERSRRLLYVALTRARRSVTVLGPRTAPSPLVSLL